MIKFIRKIEFLSIFGNVIAKNRDFLKYHHFSTTIFSISRGNVPCVHPGGAYDLYLIWNPISIRIQIKFHDLSAPRQLPPQNSDFSNFTRTALTFCKLAKICHFPQIFSPNLFPLQFFVFPAAVPTSPPSRAISTPRTCIDPSSEHTLQLLTFYPFKYKPCPASLIETSNLLEPTVWRKIRYTAKNVKYPKFWCKNFLVAYEKVMH